MTTPAGPGLRRTWRRRFDCDAVSSGKKSRTRRCSRRRAACCTPRAWPSKPMRAGVCGTQRARWIGRAGLCAETTRKRRSIFGVPCATDDGPWSTASSPTAVATSLPIGMSRTCWTCAGCRNEKRWWPPLHSSASRTRKSPTPSGCRRRRWRPICRPRHALRKLGLPSRAALVTTSFGRQGDKPGDQL